MNENTWERINAELQKIDLLALDHAREQEELRARHSDQARDLVFHVSNVIIAMAENDNGLLSSHVSALISGAPQSEHRRRLGWLANLLFPRRGGGAKPEESVLNPEWTRIDPAFPISFPPAGELVNTKIHDDFGKCVPVILKYVNSIWVFRNGCQYYNDPTHWRKLTDTERAGFRAFEIAKERIVIEEALTRIHKLEGL